MDSYHRISIRATLAATAANGTATTHQLDTSIIGGFDPTTVLPSDPIRLFLIQASVIIIFTRILAFFLAKIRQPAVIAEVIGGILLGPTVFGRIPGFTEHIFPKASIPYFNLVANLGLVLFLFIVGLEIDPRIIRRCAVPALTVSATGLLVPFALGAAVSVGIYNDLADTADVSFGHFLLFTGVAMAITALPVLARIVLSLNMMKTRVGVVALAAGVGNDVVGWILLALAIALVNASSGINALYIFLVVLGWTLLLFFIIRPAYIYLARRNNAFVNGPDQFMMTITIILLFASSFLTDAVGVHAIFGAFLAGVIMPHEGGYALKMTEKMEDLVHVVFLPLYFTLSGLNTNLGTLDSGIVWGYIIAICLIAFFSKFVACGVTARLNGFSVRESAGVGTLMSCKGLVELIALNLGLNAGILNTQIFSMFVVMALVSTFATTPLTMLLYPARYRVDFDDEQASKGARSDEADEESSKPGQSDQSSVKRYMFVLDRFENLPGLLTLVQLLRPSSDAHLRTASSHDSSKGGLRRRTNASTEKGASGESDAESSVEHGQRTGASSEAGEGAIDSVNVVSASPSAPSHFAAARAPASVQALRLVELTNRTSAVMRVAESDETNLADPLINVFGAFVRLNRLPFRSILSAVTANQFSPTVTEKAKTSKSDVVIIPWTLPAVGLLGNVNAKDGNGASIFSRPYEALFGAGGSDPAELTHEYQAGFVRRVVQTSPCHVGMLLERSRGDVTQQHALERTTISSWGQHVVFGFMGGPDDRCALDMVLRWSQVNKDVFVSIYRYRKSDASADELRTPHATLDHVDSVRRTQATNALYGNVSVHDTMYPQSNLNPLQAQLQDDVAIDTVERALQSDSDLARRVAIHETVTPTPLAHLINVVQAKDASYTEKEDDNPDVPPASLIVLGRNRRLPTISHRDELRALLRRRGVSAADGDDAHAGEGPSVSAESESRLIDGEMSKIIGQAALAVCGVGQCALPTLVVASSLHRPAAGEEDS